MTHNAEPDYEALAAEVITLMATMRPSQRPPRRDGHQAPCPTVPHPPAIPPDLMEIGRGSIGVLEALSRSDKPTTPGQIGLMTGLSKGRVSNIIRGLEEKGYVTKYPSPTDNRSVTVALSAKGQQVTQQHHDALRAHVASMLRQLGPQDAQDGVRVMRHLLQIMQANCMAHDSDCPCRAFGADDQQEPSTPIFCSSGNPGAAPHPSPSDARAHDNNAPRPSDTPSRPAACAAPHKQHPHPACPGKDASSEVGA